MASNPRRLTAAALFAAFIAVGAYLRIPLGPVPLTLQVPAVLLAGYCLGPRLGAAAAILYAAVGLAGAPVFTSGGGPASLASPTFGYILGFIPCAIIAGFAAKINRRESIPVAYAGMILALVGVYAPGVVWFMAAVRWLAPVPADIRTIVTTALLFPLAGNLLTTIPAAAAAVALRPRIGKF